MTEEHRQRLSQLIDGELDPGHAVGLLRDMGGDPGLQAAWERYHLIGQALRREPIDVRHRAIAQQVRARLAAEPTVLAPRRGTRSRRQSLQRAGAAAMAASLALGAFLAAPLLFDDSASAPGARPAIARLVERESISMQRLQREQPGLASKLDLYLVTHQATAPATGAKGMLPYAALVGYEARR